MHGATIRFSQHIFEKHTNIKFRENPFLCESRCYMWTDVKQLTVVLRNFAKVSKEKLRKISH